MEPQSGKTPKQTTRIKGLKCLYTSVLLNGQAGKFIPHLMVSTGGSQSERGLVGIIRLSSIMPSGKSGFTVFGPLIVRLDAPEAIANTRILSKVLHGRRKM